MRRYWVWTGALALLVGLGWGAWQVGAQGGGAPRPPRAAQRIQKSIDDYRAKLVEEGKYACCVKPGCDICVTHMGMCPCGANAAAGRPVCRECKGGWEAGQGNIPGKRPSDIRVMRPEGAR